MAFLLGKEGVWKEGVGMSTRSANMGDSGAICGHESRTTDKYSRDTETRR